MSEQSCLEALAALLRGVAEFDADDVTICDWRVLDGSSMLAPFAILEPSDEFSVVWNTSAAEATWNPIVSLIVRFVEWDESKAELYQVRQAIIDALDSGPGQTLGLAVREIRSDGAIGEIYDRYNQNPEESIPVYLVQRMIIRCEEF